MLVCSVIVPIVFRDAIVAFVVCGFIDTDNYNTRLAAILQYRKSLKENTKK